MWVARDKDGKVHLFYYKPYRANNSLWTCDVPGVEASWHHWEFIVGYWMKLDDSLFPDLKWEDEPVEVGLYTLSNNEEIEDSITLTRYEKDYDKTREWFINMLKRQPNYEAYTDEQLEDVWKEHLKEEYTFDEIWDTIQCDGYTKIMLPMGRHDHQPEYDYVCETKEYIDEKIKKPRK